MRPIKDHDRHMPAGRRPIDSAIIMHAHQIVFGKIFESFDRLDPQRNLRIANQRKKFLSALRGANISVSRRRIQFGQRVIGINFKLVAEFD